MANYQSSLPLVFKLARKVQQTGRAADLYRTFSGTGSEIASYYENLLTAANEMSEAICTVGNFMTKQHDEAIDPDQLQRIGMLLITLGEMSDVLNEELFFISERTRT